jgi:hypothetical protein
LGVAVLWLAPLIGVAMVVHRERESFAGQFWSSGWPLLYGVSLLALLLPRGWFRLRSWERDGRIYRAIGIRFYKRFMIGGDIDNRLERRRRDDRRAFVGEALRHQLIAQSVSSERTHIVMFLFSLWPTLFGIATGWWGYVALVTLGNVLVNAYPIALQRYTRGRLLRIDRPIARV